MTSSIVKPLGAVSRRCSAEWVADRDRRVADLHLVGVAELERMQRHAVRRLDLQHRQVGVDVAAHDLRGQRALRRQHDAHVGRAGDDVRVGQDSALLVENEARAGRLVGARAPDVERRVGLLHGARPHEHDARRIALVDRARRHPQPRHRRARGRQRGGLDHLLRRPGLDGAGRQKDGRRSPARENRGEQCH
jgi:hypothetical protein